MYRVAGFFASLFCKSQLKTARSCSRLQAPEERRLSVAPKLDKAAATATAGAYIQATVGKALAAVKTASDIMAALQRHYQAAVLPHVAPSFSDLSHCSSGVMALVNTVNRRHAALYALHAYNLR